MTKEIGPIVWTDTPHGKQAVIDHGPEQTVLAVDEYGYIVITTYPEPGAFWGCESCISGDAYANFGDGILHDRIRGHLRTIEEAGKCPSE